MGQCQLEVKLKNERKENLLFYVTVCEPGAPPLFGLKSIQKMKLVTRVESVNDNSKIKDIFHEFRELFQGLGGISDYVYDMKLKDEIEPKKEPCRRVPIQLMKPLKNELDYMEKVKVIEKVTEPTDWINALILVRKTNNKLRICLDPQQLNKALKHENYHLTTFEEIATKLSEATKFSTLDASQAF